MTLGSRLRSWADGLLRRPRLEKEMEAELRTHVAARAEDLVRQGVPEGEAGRRARLEFGGEERVKEECRQARGLGWVEAVGQDLRFGARMLRKTPVLTLAAVLILAVGIAANAAVFSAAGAILLHPLPYARAARLAWITESLPGVPDNNVSWLDMQDWKRQNDVFQGIAGYSDFNVAMTPHSGEPELLRVRYTSAGYFGLLGIRPLLGRTFTPAEHARHGPPAAIVAYSYWRQHFGGAASALERPLELDNKAWTVVGVMPPGYGRITHTQLWLPFEEAAGQSYFVQRQFSWSMYAVARLKPGVTFLHADSELTAISRRLERRYPGTTGGLAVMMPLARHVAGDLRPALLLLATAVLLLLLVACANIASLLLARALAREGEFAMRRALGAGRWRLFRQLMLAGLVLSMAAAALAAPLGYGGAKLLAGMLPAGAPFAAAVGDAGTLWLAAAIAAAAGVLFGLGPALLSVRAGPRGGAPRAVARRVGAVGAHYVLAVAEVGMAAALLIGAGLMWRSMAHLLRVPAGFDAHHLLAEDLVWNWPGSTASVPANSAPLVYRVLDRVRALPGVRSAGIGFPVPFAAQDQQTYLAIPGRPRGGKPIVVNWGCASKGYFRTLRIPLLEGRTFDLADTRQSRPVAVIDQELARRYWPGVNPVNRQIKLGVENFDDPSQTPATIIGVVGTVKAAGLATDLGGYVYQPYSQSPRDRMMTVVARTAAPPLSLAHPVEEALHATAPYSPVSSIRTEEAMLEGTQATRSLCLDLLAGFAFAALILALLGVYGVLSYLVSRRTGEIGVRMALGAQRGQILGLVLGRGAWIGLAGVGFGVAAALALAHTMAALLFGVSAGNVRTYFGVTLGLLAMVLMACFVPARRAAGLDPVTALRHE